MCWCRGGSPVLCTQLTQACHDPSRRADPRPAGGQPARWTSPPAAEPTARSACQPVSEHKFGLFIASHCQAWRTARTAPCLPGQRTGALDANFAAGSIRGQVAKHGQSLLRGHHLVTYQVVAACQQGQHPPANAPAPVPQRCQASRQPGPDPAVCGRPHKPRASLRPAWPARCENRMPSAGTSDAAASEGSPVVASAHLTTTDHAPGQFWLDRPLPRRGWPSRCAPPHARCCAQVAAARR